MGEAEGESMGPIPDTPSPLEQMIWDLLRLHWQLYAQDIRYWQAPDGRLFDGLEEAWRAAVAESP
jgi:hypothetical protein